MISRVQSQRAGSMGSLIESVRPMGRHRDVELGNGIDGGFVCFEFLKDKDCRIDGDIAFQISH